ncbi:MAG: protein kinase [Proteobacteria bacterium]|nr:protein kinase [Pseudomonadota bacterium]
MQALPKPIPFGRYLLTEHIAVGGMAEIFGAKIVGAMGFEKNVAIKRILPQFASDASFVQMFVTEAKLVCHLEHPNIVQVLELGEIDGQYFIAMERVNGLDARRLWRTLAKQRQRLPGVLALFITAELLRGLHYAHRALGGDGRPLGVVHRDVSPSNILVSLRGDVKLSDFGIALVQQESATQAGTLKGKYGYMSPEQVTGIAVDGRSDIFSAGIVLAELVLGRRLFAARNDFETLNRVVNVRLDVLDRHAAALPPEVVTILRRMLERRPDDRYPTAQAAHDDIVDFLYQRRTRVSQETLAGFIAQYVAPQLGPSAAERDATAEAGEDDSSGGIHPRRAPTAAPRSHPPLAAAQRVALDETELEGPTRHRAPGTAAIAGATTSAAPETAVAVKALAPHAAAPPTGRASAAPTGPHLPLETTGLLDVFGAIPLLAIEEGTSLAGELSLDQTPVSRPRDLLDASGSGHRRRAGMELDPSALLATEAPGLPRAGEGGVALPTRAAHEPHRAAPRSAAADASAGATSRQPPLGSTVSSSRSADFSGSLALRSVAKVLYRFAAAEETGLLLLSHPAATESAETTGEHAASDRVWVAELSAELLGLPAVILDGDALRAIYCADGQPRLLAAERSDELLVAFLLQRGLTTREDVARAARARAHRGLVAALIADGRLSPLHVSRATAAFVTERVTETFAWSAGQFAFFRGHEAPANAFPCDLRLVELLQAGVACLSRAALTAYFARLRDCEVRRLPAPPPGAPNAALLQLPTLGALYQRLATAESTTAIIASAGPEPDDPLGWARALYLLLECELAQPV